IYPPLPCKDEEFHAILDTMFADGAIKPVRSYKVPTGEEKCDPMYCRYNQFVGHPTTACQTLRKILHTEIHDGTLELPYRKQAFDEDPWPKRRGKEMAAIITCYDDLLDNDVFEVFTLDMPEERHSGASFGQQDYREAAAVTSHNLTDVEESAMGYELQITL
ncbi:unnamed protein product, partial [Prunus brigantina]